MPTSILKVLTELTALSPTGITILKPFRPWFGLPQWRGRPIGLRLLNAGELEQALDFINSVASAAQEQALKKEILARSVWSVDGSYVAKKEDVEEYNALHKTELGELEYKRVFVEAFEQFLIDYLYSVYLELQNKQSRKVFGVFKCATCQQQYNEIPNGSRLLKFQTSDIICPDCLPRLSPEDMFEFEAEIETASNTPVPEVAKEQVETQNVVRTQKDFATLEEYQDYLLEQAEKNATAQNTVPS